VTGTTNNIAYVNVVYEEVVLREPNIRQVKLKTINITHYSGKYVYFLNIKLTLSLEFVNRLSVWV